MAVINESFRKLPGNYLFSETARRAAQWKTDHPGERLISLGVGDVTQPLPEAASEAMAAAAREMATAAGFHGYGPEQGYGFLREVISEWDYRARGTEVSPDEIFVTDGAKSVCGDILDLFGKEPTIALSDPVYPAYADGAAITGRGGKYDSESKRWSKLRYLPCTEGNGFIAEPPDQRVELVYLCFPNNPTGAMATREQMERWVTWANACGAVILFDGAYEAFVQTAGHPRSIYEIPGAKNCAIEFRSFSKTAGFTGVRCGYAVIPERLERDGENLLKLWRRRQAARSNGVSYVVQRGAEALYSLEGQSQIRERISCYRQNAADIRSALISAGLTVFGGVDAPYIWMRVPSDMDSWTCFDLLLHRCGVVTTPGAGFGPCGEGYLRLTAFGCREDTAEAIRRIKNLLA